MRRLKGSLQPTLHMDLIDHRLSSSDSIEILGVNYDTTTLDVFILKPPRSTHLPGGNAAGGRTEKAVKQEKSNNIRGAISSVLEISHPLYRELATVRTRLTAVERKTRQEQRRPLFPFFPLFIMFSNISYMPLLHLWMLPGLQVCEGKKKKKKRSDGVSRHQSQSCETDPHSVKKERGEDSQMRA